MRTAAMRTHQRMLSPRLNNQLRLSFRGSNLVKARTCPNCHYHNKEDAWFCTQCGKGLLKIAAVTRNEDKAILRLKRAEYSARRSIIRQLLAGLACLLFGGFFIFILTFWANSWDVSFADGSDPMFGLTGYMYGSIALLFTIGYVTYNQFTNKLQANDVYHLSVKTTFYFGIFVLGFSLIAVISSPTFKLFFSTILYNSLLFLGLGQIIGGIQMVALKLEPFDPENHIQLTGNKADLNACKLGILPYRQQVRSFWHSIISLAIGALFSFFLFIILQQDDKEIGVIISFLFIGGAVYGFFFQMFLILYPSICYVEGSLTDRKYVPYRGRYRPEVTQLFCQGKSFNVDRQTFFGVHLLNRKYRFYYPSLTNRIIAFELLGKQSANDKDDENFSSDIPSLKSQERAKLSKASPTTLFATLGAVATAVLFWFLRKNKNQSQE